MKEQLNETRNRDRRSTRNRLRNSRPRGWWCFVCHRAVVIKLSGEIKTLRLSVRGEYEFTPQHGKESKMPDEKLTGHFVLATSYSRTAYRRTTIGAAAFHFRVRNGNGWCHYAIVTRVRNRTGGSLLSQRRKREAESLETSDDSNQSPYLNFERTRFSIGTRKSQIENLFGFAGIYIQVFGNKSAENSGRYNI